MLRIGIAASKMSKGSLLSYNLYVILIACLFSLFIFLICGFSILLDRFFDLFDLTCLKACGFSCGLGAYVQDLFDRFGLGGGGF